MLSFILWYLTISLLGLLTFPLAYHLFPALADRGYSFSRALGLLLWGFIFWLAVSFGLVRNDGGGLLLALALLAGLSAWAMWTVDGGRWTENEKPSLNGLASIVEWLKSNRATVLTTEILFLVAFAFMAFVRANNPENIGTEKPMEMAFINAILRSPTFPPHDPWLSGYAISYYHFGYILAAMLAKFTLTSGGLAFNLMLALVFGLSAVCAFGLLYNLLAAYWKKSAPEKSLLSLTSLLGPLFLLIISNVQGFLEFLHTRGIGWTGQPGDFNVWTSLGQLARPNLLAYNFWTWLDIKDLREIPAFTESPRFWFWWRASRVVHDYDLMGNFIEVIDEFPFFSYLLGDLHPHVLAMPFGLLAAGLALNLFLGGWQGEINLKWFKLPIRADGFAVLAVVLGGLAFLNTWDFPIYLAVAAGALILSLVQERGWGWELLEDFLKFSIPLGIASIALYLPFYVTFSSQAGGILPNVIFPTRGAHLWVMFGTLLVPLFLFLVHTAGSRAANWKTGFVLTIGFTALLALFSLAVTLYAAQTEAGKVLVSSQGVSSLADVLREALSRRLAFGGGLLTLVLLIGAALAYLTAKQAPAESEPQRAPLPFVWMLILFGGLLVLAPEFVYLRDQFGTRMNTVFKFYYQAWALWSIAAAFGAVVVLREARGWKLALSGAALGLVLVVGLAYPILSLPNKTNNFNANNPAARTLDGSMYLFNYSPDDYMAIQYLQTLPLGVVAEAVGGSYSEYARVATYSGQPNVLGWPGHEGQWRGGYEEQGTRIPDLETLYQTQDWETARAILDRYDIRYVYIGALERGAYSIYEDKFAVFLREIYRQGQVVIYEVP
jgi:YYY domain-containing protein